MEKIELTRKAFEVLKGGMTFNSMLYAYEGGACGGGWDDEYELELSQAQLLYLISQQGVDGRIFEGLELEPVDVKDVLSTCAEEGACVDEFYEDSDYDDEEEVETVKGCWSYSGECEPLDYFLESWKTVIDKIDAGEITEENLDKWLRYFDDAENFDQEIECWAEYAFDEEG